MEKYFNKKKLDYYVPDWKMILIAIAALVVVFLLFGFWWALVLFGFLYLLDNLG